MWKHPKVCIFLKVCSHLYTPESGLLEGRGGNHLFFQRRLIGEY